MSTSEPVVDNRFLKTLTAVCALVPGVLLVWDGWRGQLGVNHVNFVIRTTGLVGLVLLTLSLVITPLRELTGWNRLIAMRRRLGVLGFAYLAVHFGVFFLFDRQASVSSTVHEIVTRRYLWFGTAALVLLIPLALTSTDANVTRLGAARWKRLHRLAYVALVGAVVHYYLLVKSDVTQPLAFAAVIGVLLLYRLVSHYLGLRAAVRAARARSGPAAERAPRPRFWSGELVVTRIFDETPDVKTFRLASVDGGPLPFSHAAGQYLNLSLTVEGRRVNRSYTIASSPAQRSYCEISVKRAPDAYGSRHLHEVWWEGQRVKVSAPAGSFVFSANDAARVVLIAGGIGVTPMMSIVRRLTDEGWRGGIYLLFSVKAVADIVFRDELRYLESRFPNLHVRIVVTRDPNAKWDGLRGAITRDVIAGFVPHLIRGPVFVCGPDPMMTAMRDILVGMGVPDADVLQEAFVSRPAVEAGADAALSVGAGEPVPAGAGGTVVFRRTGKTADASSTCTVLEAAEDAGVSIPFECRSGICGQCKTAMVSGQVAMDVQDALTSADRARGLILACQARVLRDVEVDA